jgi:hypothetical protein
MKNLKSFLFLLCISAPFIIAAQHNNNIEKKDSYVLTDIIKMMYLWDVLILLPPNIVPSIDIMMPPFFFADALSYLMKSRKIE